MLHPCTFDGRTAENVEQSPKITKQHKKFKSRQMVCANIGQCVCLSLLHLKHSHIEKPAAAMTYGFWIWEVAENTAASIIDYAGSRLLFIGLINLS